MRTVLAVLLAALLLPAAIGVPRGVAASSARYAPLSGDAAAVPAAPGRPHDPAKPTAVVVVGAKGAEVSDVLAPFETLAASGAFNVYTAAPVRRPLPLTGGLHLVPDVTFADLEARLDDRAADVVVVPALPDVERPSADPVTTWLRQQAGDGALVVGVCSGARVLASAGLLDGREATSHWARIDDFAAPYPEVTWVRGTRYVEDGDVITTGGILSAVDGTLRAIERLVDADTARRAAEAVGWRFYSPGAPAALPVSRLGPDAVILPLNAAYRRARVGVVLGDGVGELELASVFDTYNGQSLAARTVALSVDGDAVVSRHGLVFVPAAALDSVGRLDRLLVPGAAAARRRDPDLAAAALAEHGLPPEHLHDEAGFPYEATLRDLAHSVDVPTARWTAKVLEYPLDDVPLSGPAWPWQVVLAPLLLTLAGAAAVVGLVRALRRPRPAGAAEPLRETALEEATVTTAPPLVRPPRPAWRRTVTSRAFVVHYLQMLAAMGLGMLVLMPLTMLVDGARAEVDALLMATTMAAGMTAWMAWRRHPWRAIVEMDAAMVLAFVVLFPLLWLGLLSEATMLVAGHVLMLPAMAAVMLRRPHHH